MNQSVPQPFWIETKAGALFAWHHRPCEVVREAAVLLCKPLGHEAACTHRAYRHLAQRLAAAGFHVLRFDYDGTGDSSGDDSDGDRVSAWIDSVRAAVMWLKTRLGATKVVLFGARFGALMALTTAAHDDVDALVLFGPPASGRIWLREARALQSLLDGDGRKRVPVPDGGEEVAGFLFSGPTIEALTSLDPLAGQHSANAVLLIARDDLPGAEDRLASKLEARGALVTFSKTPGYGGMMHYDPHRSVIPDEVWSEIETWMTARYSAVSITQPAPSYMQTAVVRENAAAPIVREHAVEFGGLFGILTEPAEFVGGSAAPAILLHNIGVNPHFGSNRLYVGMARRFAALGFPVLRFDSAGLGDSPANGRVDENRVYSQSAIADSHRAMDFLVRARGIKRFVLMGLCSGAFVSFHAGVADPRVVGVVLMNILVFQWKEGDSIDVRKRDAVKSTRFYSQALFERAAWARLLRGDVHISAIAQGLLHKAWERGRVRVARALAGESNVARGFRAMVRRGAHVLIVFSAEDGGRDVVDEHLGVDGELLRNEPGFQLEVIDGTDHTFSPLWSREALFSLLSTYLVSHFASVRLPGANSRGTCGTEEAAASLDRVSG